MLCGTKPDGAQKTKSEPLYTAAPHAMHAASRACRAPGPRAAACARPLPHARFASRTHAIAPLRAPGTPRPTYAAPVTRTDAVILRLQSHLAQIARPYSTQPINPALGRTAPTLNAHPAHRCSTGQCEYAAQGPRPLAADDVLPRAVLDPRLRPALRTCAAFMCVGLKCTCCALQPFVSRRLY